MDRYKSAWQGAAEGINSGIDNAIKLYSARNAQEDQAYKQTLRQREEAEYAEKMKPLGTVGDVVSRYEEGPESRKIMLTTIRTVLGKGENDPLLRHEGEKIMGVLGVDQKKALFDSTGKDVANKIKTMTDAYSKMDKNAPEALATKQEIDSLNQRHLAYTTESRKYQREIDEELRKQAEEKRKEEIHPLEQKKLTAEIGKLNALAAQARARGSAEGGLTPAQQRQATEHKRTLMLKAVDDAIKEYHVIQKQFEDNPALPKPPNYNDIINGISVANKAKQYLLDGGDPSKMSWCNPS